MIEISLISISAKVLYCINGTRTDNVEQVRPITLYPAGIVTLQRMTYHCNITEPHGITGKRRSLVADVLFIRKLINGRT